MSVRDHTAPRPGLPIGVSNGLVGLDRRVLPFSSVLAQAAAGAMPAAMALSTPSLLGRIVGPGAWLSVVIAGAVMWLVNLTLRQFSTRVASSGSLFSFAAQGLGPAGALAVAVCMLCAYGTLASYGLVQSSEYLPRLLDPSGPRPSVDPLNSVLVVLMFAALCFAIMARGVRRAGRFTLSVEAITLVLLALLLGLSVIERGSVDLQALSVAGADPGRVLSGVMAMFSVFFCIECAASLSAESAQPFKSVPRATSIATAAMVSLCLASLLVAAPQSAGDAGQHGAEHFWFPEAEHHSLLAFAIVLVRLLCNLGSVLAVWTCLSRLVFTCARSGLLPARWGGTDPSVRTPVAALVVTAPFVVGPAVVLTLASSDVRWAEHQVLGASNIAFFLMYAMTCLAAPLFLRRIGEDLWSTTAIAVIASAVTSAAIVWTVVDEWRGGRVLSLATIAVLSVVVAGWRFAVLHRGRFGLTAIGTHDATILSDVHVPADPVTREKPA